MKTKQLLLISATVVVCAGVVIAIVAVASKCKRTYLDTYVYSSAASLNAAIRRELPNNQNVIAFFTQAGGKWKSLNQNDYDKMINGFGISEIERSPGQRDSKLFLDSWGQRFVVLYRKLDKDLDIMVISKGADGIYGTADDVISGFSNEPPKSEIQQ